MTPLPTPVAHVVGQMRTTPPTKITLALLHEWADLLTRPAPADIIHEAHVIAVSHAEHLLDDDDLWRLAPHPKRQRCV